MVLFIMLFIIYIVGIWVYIENASFYSITITPKNARIGLLWPILIILLFIIVIISVFCSLLNFLFLVFGYCTFQESKFYKFIDGIITG